jgi:hypothetical protein
MMRNNLEDVVLALMPRMEHGKSFTYRTGTSSIDEDRIEYEGYTIYWDKGVWFFVEFLDLGEKKTLELEITELLELLLEDIEE